MRWLVPLAFVIFGRCGRADPEAEQRLPVVSTSTAPTGVASVPATKTLDWIADLPSCDVEHEGVFLDLGAPMMASRHDHTMGPFDDGDIQERGGASFERVHTRRLAYDFNLGEQYDRATVSIRALGVASRQVSVYLDDRRAGVLLLSRDEPTIVSAPPLDGFLRGAHTVTLRFGGGAQGADDPYAEVDWIRIGNAGPATASYAPPALRDIVTDVVLDGTPKRSIVLRDPSTVRCVLRVTPAMKLRTDFGYWGNGHGVGTVRVIEDGEQPATLVERKVTGGTGAVWTPALIELGKFAGRVVGIELSASGSTGGGRVAFGEPKLISGAEGPPEEISPAPAVVIIVAAGLDRRLVPPWGAVGGLPAIGKLARDGVAFDRYRAPTTVVSAVMASLLTGLSPRAHGLEDPSGRLSDEVRLVGERAKEGSVHSAFFTGVPMSFPPFGFDRGWDRYEAISPVKDMPATEPFARGAAWIAEQAAADKDARLLLVVHARGGHPPWDVTRDEVGLLPPEEYNGALEPRAGALVLANLRAQRVRGPVDRLSGADWRRLHALEETAQKKQDLGLRRIIDVLEKQGLYDRSLIVFMGDVAVGDPPAIPFAPAPALREDVLLAPLIVKFPGGTLAGTHVGAMATTVDISRTLLGGLGAGTEGLDGVDLLRLAKGDAPLDGHPLVATLGPHYATRFGPWLLSGDLGRRPTLCQTDVDPACVSNALVESPFAAAALWQRTYDAEVEARKARGARIPVAVGLDADTQAALKVFGY